MMNVVLLLLFHLAAISSAGSGYEVPAPGPEAHGGDGVPRLRLGPGGDLSAEGAPISDERFRQIVLRRPERGRSVRLEVEGGAGIRHDRLATVFGMLAETDSVEIVFVPARGAEP
jgi:hypothetical protein